MTFESIDWANILSTLSGAAIGGWVAAGVARQQIGVTLKAERDRVRKEVGRELIEAVDSYVHIAYRDAGDNVYERQRLHRRILSLTMLAVPERFTAVQEHLDLVIRWWKRPVGQLVPGAGLSATERFFEELKSAVFVDIFERSVSFAKPA